MKYKRIVTATQAGNLPEDLWSSAATPGSTQDESAFLFSFVAIVTVKNI